MTIPIGLLKAISLWSCYWMWMWVTEEMPSSITQLWVKVQFPFCPPYKQDEVFPLHGVISLKHYILLGKGLLFFLPIHSASTLLQDHLVSGSIGEINQIIKMAYIYWELIIGQVPSKIFTSSNSFNIPMR